MKTVTVTWRPRPGRWPGSRATPPTSPARPRSSSSAPPPAVAHREEFRMCKHDLQPGRSPTTIASRSGAPEHRVRRPGTQPLDRTPNRLESQEIRSNPTPLPHRDHPRRKPHSHRRGPATRRHPRRLATITTAEEAPRESRPAYSRRRFALNCPNSESPAPSPATTGTANGTTP